MKFYNVTELQNMFGISRSIAYQLIKRADFPTVRIGKRIVIPEEALREWLARGGTQQREA